MRLINWYFGSGYFTIQDRYDLFKKMVNTKFLQAKAVHYYDRSNTRRGP